MASRRVELGLLVLVISLALGLAAEARAALRVVATTPDVADMARRIGGERVQVDVLAEGASDPHRVPMKPSFVTKLNRADAVVVSGLGLEEAFLPGLLEVARNAAILPGAPGYVDASLHVAPLAVPSSQDRSQGELHPLGNPHFNLDPVRGKDMARAIAEGLARVDPEGEDAYRAGLASFVAELDRRIVEWARVAAPLRGAKVVSYHEDLVYLADRYGLDVIGTIELKPGIPPTPRHVEELVARMRREGVRIVVREVSYQQPLAERIAEQTGAKLATVSVLTGGLPGTESYLDFVDANLRALVAALEAAPASPPPGAASSAGSAAAP